MNEDNQGLSESPENPVEVGTPPTQAPEPEKEIDLNALFPNAESDLNTLFPDDEIKRLLKNVSKVKKDLHRMTERFKEENDLKEEASEEESSQE